MFPPAFPSFKNLKTTLKTIEFILFFKEKLKIENHKTLNILCVIFILFIINLKSDFSTVGASQQTASGTFTASIIFEPSCTASATVMSFGTYDGSVDKTATSTLSINLTNGSTFRVTMADTVISPDSEGDYRLWLNNDSTSGDFVDYLKVYFKNPAGNKLHYSGLVDANNIVGIGTGVLTTVATITGVIPSGQTGKNSGSFSRNVTLNIAYQ